MSVQTQNKSIKRTFWTVLVFYLLIAFEIIYMVSPFAMYYYSVYAPGLNFFNNSPATAWLSSFFLPHMVAETRSAWLNLHGDIGLALAGLGLLGFAIGAGQIYFYKLTRRGAVIGGIYNYIRHPQYVSLAVCSLGLLLLWPRYLVLMMFIAMLVAYYFLARAEERECEAKFGDSYREYKERTRMFVPFSVPLVNKLPALPQTGWRRYVSILALYVVITAAAVGVANGLKSYAVSQLYTYSTPNSVTIAIGRIDDATFEQVMTIALADAEVQQRLAGQPDAKFLNYLVPTGWYVTEVPINPVAGREGGHLSFPGYGSTYKIAFTRAELRTDNAAAGLDIISQTVNRRPALEVTVDLVQNKVVDIQRPDKVRLENVPLPLF